MSMKELRIYEVTPDRFDELRERFSRLTLPLFERHGFRVQGPWWFEDGDGRFVVYLLEWSSAAERDELLQVFRSDPEWIEGLAKSEQDGPLTERISVHLLEPLL
jgi:hypothetical protein